MLRSCILHWNLNCSLCHCLQIQNITSNLVSVYLMLLQHFEYFWIEIQHERRNFTPNPVQNWLDDADCSTKLLLESVVILLAVPSPDSGFDWFSPFGTFEPQSKSFQSSVDFFSVDSLGGVKSFELPEQLDQLDFIFFGLSQLLVGSCSACCAFDG